MKIYIGCSLTQAPEEFKNEVLEFKKLLREKYEVIDHFWDKFGIEAVKKASPQEIFEYDTKCVQESDLFLAICDYPSIGLGIELGLAYKLNKPTLAVAEAGSNITTMVKGMTHSNFHYIEYDDLISLTKVLTRLIN